MRALLTAAVLVHKLAADARLLSTDVPNVEIGWGFPNPCPIGHSTAAADLRGLRFPAGSMGPKLDAACRDPLRSGTVSSS